MTKGEEGREDISQLSDEVRKFASGKCCCIPSGHSVDLFYHVLPPLLKPGLARTHYIPSAHKC